MFEMICHFSHQFCKDIITILNFRIISIQIFDIQHLDL